MKKVILATLIFICIGISVHAVDEENFIYDICDCEVTITGLNPDIYIIDLVIPDEIDGYPVTKIESSAFSGAYFESVTISDTVKEIGESSFDSCSYLESVIIKEGTKHIGDYAFFGCSNLKEITLPDSIITIGSNAFSGVAIQFESKNSAAYIGNHLIWTEESFSGTYTVAEGTCSIAAEAFSNIDHSNLEHIIFPETLKGIGKSAFGYCSGLKELKFPSSVEYIADYAFVNCEGLEKVTIPENVTYIGEWAFSDCINLKYIYALNKKWDYTFDDSVQVFLGESTSPYPIKNSSDLYELSKVVNNGFNFDGIYFVLENNISLNNKEWLPIGNYDNPFCGNIDGKNYTISNYKITNVAGKYTWDGYTGFFGYTSNASIKNLKLSNFEINISNPDGNTYLGGFAGRSQSTVFENCYAEGDIMLFNETNDAYEADIAGIVAQCDYGSVISSKANCNLYYIGNETTNTDSTQVRIGGISAYTYSQITNCTSDCYIYGIGLVYRVGGIAGENTYGGNVCISGCTSNGKITVIREDTKEEAILHCGGIAGFNRELIENSKSYVDIEICGNNTVSEPIITNDSDMFFNWYCGQIFGAGYSGGNFESNNNDAYGTIRELTIPSQPDMKNISLTCVDNSCHYSVALESLKEISGKFVIALYCGNTLVGLQQYDTNIDKKILIIEGTVTTTQAPNLCKMFVWKNFVEMKPLTDAESIEITA